MSSGASNKKRPVHRCKKGKTGFVYWLLCLLSLALFFIFLSIFGQNGLLQIGELKKVRMVLMEDINALHKENNTLKKEIKALNEDPFYIEKVAREELDMVKPNEIVFHIVSSADRF